METKTLLAGIIGFILGGLLVSVAATMFDKPVQTQTIGSSASDMSMDDMTASLRGKTGDDFDKVFLAEMIMHHRGAVEMAKMAEGNAKHDEIKRMSQDIVTAQEKEIIQMGQWQIDWGYKSPTQMDNMDHGMTTE